MPIRVICPGCLKGINAPDKYAGHVAKCPGCGTPIKVPFAEPATGSLELMSESAPRTPSPPPVKRSKPCPYCGEQILASAKKCKHCGEFLDDSLRPPQPTPTIAIQRDWSPGIAALLSFIIPGAGQIYKGSIAAGLLWFVATAIGYVMLIIPGLVLHLLCIFAAAMGDPYAGSKKAAAKLNR